LYSRFLYCFMGFMFGFFMSNLHSMPWMLPSLLNMADCVSELSHILCQSLENCLVLWHKADLSSQLYTLVYSFYKPSKVAYVDWVKCSCLEEKPLQIQGLLLSNGIFHRGSFPIYPSTYHQWYLIYVCYPSDTRLLI
jgi:hypothetical protein